MADERMRSINRFTGSVRESRVFAKVSSAYHVCLVGSVHAGSVGVPIFPGTRPTDCVRLVDTCYTPRMNLQRFAVPPQLHK